MSRPRPTPPPPVSPIDPHLDARFEHGLAEIRAHADSLAAAAAGADGKMAAIVSRHQRRLELARKAVPPKNANVARRFEAAVDRMEEQILRVRQPARAPEAVPAAAAVAPVAALGAAIQQLESDLAEARKRALQAGENAGEWERRAMLAVLACDDALALEAMTQRREHVLDMKALDREAGRCAAILAVMRESADEAQRQVGDLATGTAG